MTPELQHTLNQITPWGLTVGQSALIALGVATLIGAWVILSVVLRIAFRFIRMGCLLILLAAMACGGVMFFMNLTNHPS